MNVSNGNEHWGKEVDHILNSHEKLDESPRIGVRRQMFKSTMTAAMHEENINTLGESNEYNISKRKLLTNNKSDGIHRVAFHFSFLRTCRRDRIQQDVQHQLDAYRRPPRSTLAAPSRTLVVF